MRIGDIPAPSGNLKGRVLSNPVVTRRRLLAVGIGCSTAAGIAGILREVSQSSSSSEAGRRRAGGAAAGQPSDHASRSATPVRRRTAVWQADVPFGSDTPAPVPVMVVSGDVVFVAGALTSSSQSVAGRSDPGPPSYTLHALSASNGTSKWSFPTHTNAIGGLTTTTREIYFPLFSLYAQNNVPLYALNASDGAKLWISYHAGTFGPVAAGSQIYSVNEPGTLVSLNGSDGTVLWSSTADCSSDPVVANGVLYILSSKDGPGSGGSSLLHAVRTSDGTRIWDSPGPGEGSLVTDGTVVCSGNPGDQLRAWRVGDGRQLWHSSVDGGFGVPAMAKGVIYAVNVVTGMLHALRASNGKKLWDYPVNIQTAPAVANGRVYVGGFDGGLIALRASDGTPMWEFSAQFSIGPVVAGNAVYVSDGSKVYAING